VEEGRDEACASHEQLTIIGRRLVPGEAAPNFCLDYLDLADRAIRTIGLADSAGMVRLLSVVNSLRQPRSLTVNTPSSYIVLTISSLLKAPIKSSLGNRSFQVISTVRN
jgi:hypothetical protein